MAALLPKTSRIPRSKWTQQNIKRLHNVFKENPNNFVRKISQQIEIGKSTVNVCKYSNLKMEIMKEDCLLHNGF